MAAHRRIWTGLVVLVALLAVAQVVPIGTHPGNPPVTAEPQWDSPGTRALAKQACFDCHSNETVWPGYARFAPVSWLVEHDVREGRSKLNFSEWQRPQEEAGEAAEVVREGEMPPWSYTFMHAEAKLGEADRATLARGLSATIGQGHDQAGGDVEANLGPPPESPTGPRRHATAVLVLVPALQMQGAVIGGWTRMDGRSGRGSAR